ncbi:hypothetical protein CCU68_12200 [Pseudomonas gingeri NCPPB 3146 = LMG 5327]|uniref:DUF1534 domain-containing protein n=1 Tax=Pseudomonas gingeri NCPPB 3146 = LMG 5327 TaxID=707248 RepID=A0ABX4Y5L8_9PSED|nr:hypothetical protein CCU68_12200 [Pseudomonas gingeri NCPPB 3146 = LMG 5327]
MLCVGMPHRTLRVRAGCDAERHGLRSHAERGNDHQPKPAVVRVVPAPNGSCRRARPATAGWPVEYRRGRD